MKGGLLEELVMLLTYFGQYLPESIKSPAKLLASINVILNYCIDSSRWDIRLLPV